MTWPVEETGSVVVDAMLLQHVQPVYPMAERQAGVQGIVIFSFTIGEDGKIASVRVFQSSGSLALNHAALVALQQSAFAPATLDGKPTSGTYLIEYDFRLER